MKTDPTAFSDLDQLYTQILSVYPSESEHCPSSGIHHWNWCWDFFLEVIEDILGMEEGEVKLVLRGLSSLMEENDNMVITYVIPHFAQLHLVIIYRIQVAQAHSLSINRNMKTS